MQSAADPLDDLLPPPAAPSPDPGVRPEPVDDPVAEAVGTPDIADEAEARTRAETARSFGFSDPTPPTGPDRQLPGRPPSLVDGPASTPPPQPGRPVIAAEPVGATYAAPTDPDETHGEDPADYDTALVDDLLDDDLVEDELASGFADDVTDDITDDVAGDITDDVADDVDERLPEPGVGVADGLQDGRVPERPMDPADADPYPGPQPLVELRQVAGLTSGSIMELASDTYDFAEGDHSVGFSLQVEPTGRVVVVPGSVEARVDALPVTGPTVLGSGVLDVGTARFMAESQPPLSHSEWESLRRDADEPDPVIEVPDDLEEALQAAAAKRSRRSSRRDQATAGERRLWEFTEMVREARSTVAERLRFHHPDPAQLAWRMETQAPTFADRSSAHPLFAQVAVMAADVAWLPSFDDIHAIPEAVGYRLQPLLSLPSVPVVADLTMGPLGIVGKKPAVLACARQLMLALYAASTDDLRLHLVTSIERRDAWSWARPVAPVAPLALSDHELSVVVVDGMENFADAGFTHEDALERRIGAVILADAVEHLPNYCGTVLQIDAAGTGILTNHRGDMIPGTPVGVTGSVAADLADGLVPLVRARRH